MKNFFQSSGDLRAPPYRLNPTVGGALALFHQLAQLLLIGLRDEIQWALKPEFRHDIDIAGIFLIKQRMNTVHHHVEFRPVIAILLGNASVKIQHLSADPHA